MGGCEQGLHRKENEWQEESWFFPAPALIKGVNRALNENMVMSFSEVFLNYLIGIC